MTEKVSVVMPVYNGSETLWRTLESLFQQEYPHWELIAVDDGSTDASHQILERFQQRGRNRVRIIRQENHGVSQARNVGIEHASAEVIAFMDQDDLWETNKLSRQCQVLHRNPVEVVFCDFYRFDSHTLRKFQLTNTDLNSFIHDFTHQVRSSDGRVKVFGGRVSFELLLKGYPLYPSTLLATRRLLLQVGMWDNQFRRCQDFDLSLRCSKFSSFAYIDETLVGIGRHDHNVSSDPLAQKEEDVEVLHHHLQGSYFDAAEKEVMKEYLIQRLFGLAWNHRARHNFGRARKLYYEGGRSGGNPFYALIKIISTLFPFNRSMINP